MNKETYEALKRILAILPNFTKEIIKCYCEKDNYQKDIEGVEDWIEEVAKDYTE